MKPLVILCRHGNTFDRGDKVVMVGAREDLPLTVRGVEQAQELAHALEVRGVVPARIIAGPLKRTKVFAEKVQAITGMSASIEIDPRLLEFDYGAWSGLSNEEIVALSGKEALDAWQETSARPTGVSFSPSPEQAREDAESLLRDLRSVSGCCVVVTSNGRLRELGRVLSTSTQSFKVKTGHACVISPHGNGWQILGWDLAPQQLADLLVAR